MISTCEYCGMSQSLTTVFDCQKCGAPLKPKERPTIRQRLLSALVSQPIEWSEGIDVSVWQGDMNWNVAKPRIDFAIMRASINVWEDKKYAQNVDDCADLDIVHGVYHYCRPEYSWKDQSSFFANRVVGDMPAWTDIETTGGLSPFYLQQWLYNFVSAVEDKTGYPVGIYTRGTFWNPYVGRNNWAGDKPLWVARYSDYLTGPWSDGRYRPYEWDTWTIWQWSADGNGEGSEYGAQSASIDKNRFNGTTEDFFTWIGKEVPEPQPPDDGCAKYVVNVDVLNVRSGPGTNYQIIGKLRGGDTVSIHDIAGKDVWIEFEPGKFCAHTYNGIKYLDKVEDR